MSEEVKRLSVKRPRHPYNESELLFCLHDSFHGVSHVKCQHRSASLVRQLQRVNTSASEQVNRGSVSLANVV